MNTLIVGYDNSTLFAKRTTYSLKSAIENAQDGDIIKIEPGYSPYQEEELTHLIINKNINIIGNSHYNENNVEVIESTIPYLSIKGGVNVLLEKICIRNEIDGKVSAFINEKSNVVFRNVLFLDKSINGNTINIQDESKLLLDNCSLQRFSNDEETYPTIFST